MASASIETTLELWASSQRDVKSRLHDIVSGWGKHPDARVRRGSSMGNRRQLRGRLVEEKADLLRMKKTLGSDRKLLLHPNLAFYDSKKPGMVTRDGLQQVKLVAGVGFVQDPTLNIYA